MRNCILRVKHHCVLGDALRHSPLRVLSSTLLTATMGLFAVAASAQTPAKESVWDKMKKAAQQAGQQKQPQKPPQPGQQPGQRQNAQGLANDSGPFKPPAGTKIEEKILAPLQEGAKFSVSPHGIHVATVTNEGSRTVVYYDGVAGPKFDQILDQGTQTIVFSPDGNRYAYCARAGNQYVVMVDGKELVRSSESLGGTFSGVNCELGFTSNNQHVYYFSQVTVTNPTTNTFVRFVFDGKPGPPSSTDGNLRGVAFSPDGDHFAYVWSDPKRQKPSVLIVDGKPAPYQAGAPQWTNDSKHLYTQRQVPGGGTELLFDGKPITRAFSFRVYTAPVGDMVVVAVTGGTNFHPFSFLVVNGKKVAGSDTVERGSIDNVVFSPDGKHYAAICGDISSHRYVIADGKRGQEYNAVDHLAFAPDSSIFAYTSSVNGKNFIVVGDQEFGGSIIGVQPPVVAPAGNRVGSFLTVNGKPSLLIDGKVTPLNGRGGTDLGFSPDGTHYAYFVVDAGNGSRLVLDGVPQPQSALSGDYVDLEHTVAALKYVFSPDSKHVAHFATSATARGVFLDGKFIPTTLEGVNTKLVFSPDSKHLFWIHMYGDQPNRVFIDGRPLVEFYAAGSTLGTIPHWWEFGPDGTLSFLAQDDNSLKRITITLSAATNIAAMLGGVTTAANSH